MSKRVNFEFQKLYIIGNFYVYLPRLIDTEDKDTIDSITNILLKNKDHIDEQLTSKGVLYPIIIQLLELKPFKNFIQKNPINNSLPMSYWECVLVYALSIILFLKFNFFINNRIVSLNEIILTLIFIVIIGFWATTSIIYQKNLRKKTLEKLKKHFEN